MTIFPLLGAWGGEASSCNAAQLPRFLVLFCVLSAFIVFIIHCLICVYCLYLLATLVFIIVFYVMMMKMMKLPILPCAEKRASFVYRTKNVDNNDKDSKNRKQSH